MPPETTPTEGAAFIKTIIGIIAAIVIVGGGGYWFASQNGNGSDTAGMPVPNENATEQERTVSGSLADIWKQGGNYMCTVSVTDPNAVSSGTVYIAGDRIRGDFTSQTQGQSVQSSMIRMGGMVYTWTNLYPQGFKTPSIDTSDPFGGSGDAGSVPAGAGYDCDPWTPDESKFELPPGVTFMSLPGQQ